MLNIENERHEDLYKFLDSEALMYNEYHLETIRVLTQDKTENINRCREILKQSKKRFIFVAIGKYREEIMQQGRGDVSSIEIIEAYNKNDIYKLRELLTELFLEYISLSEVKDAVRFAKNGNISFEDIYKKHMKALENGEYNRFMCIVTSLYRE